MPQEHAGQSLDLEVCDGVALRLGEVANLTLRELQVLEDRCRDGLDDLADLIFVEPERIR